MHIHLTKRVQINYDITNRGFMTASFAFAVQTGFKMDMFDLKKKNNLAFGPNR